MKVLVTGGAGYIGSELVFKLSQLAEVEQIFVYDNLSNQNTNLFISASNRMRNGKVKFVQGELLDSRLLKKYVNQVDVVYHLAAITNMSFHNVDSHAYEQTNHWGTAELVYAVEEAENVKKLIFVSSTGVYGFSPNDAFLDEESRLNPRSFYDISKMRAEEHVKRLIAKKDNVVIFRPANVYGYSPGIHFNTVINRFLFESNFNGRISINGNGKQKRSFIHIQKLMDVLIFPLLNELPSDIYNVADFNSSILDIVDVFKEVFPELEFIFINQHLELKDLVVKVTDTKLSKFITLPETVLKEDIIRFKETRFAF